MLCVWCPVYFRDVDGYDAWETRVNERLSDAISAGELVPVNIRSDGAFGVRVATDPPDLTERERTFAVVTSEPYLLEVTGGELCLGGIEGVGASDRAPLRVTLPDGRYAVRATIVAWDEEPGGRGPDGKPAEGALRTSSSRFPPRTVRSSTAPSKSHSTRPRDLICRRWRER
jgi:hypothetical protein